MCDLRWIQRIFLTGISHDELRRLLMLSIRETNERGAEVKRFEAG
ncbi:hypothetical protein B4135_1372 [Caldibacillus debilis]|uniref:Uncharacterized protein n=1 Tax=Caldibacillus debilis TaxID=301148 RepID=A0A150MD73_9BACI|nr:hypothetical protein B4135_1372 [Caldibacillus debilis]